MPRNAHFLADFKHTIAFAFENIRGMSVRDFNRLYDYDDFLESEAVHCSSPRELASAFVRGFLGEVSPAYLRLLAFAVVRYLARQSGRAVETADYPAIKALAELDHADAAQFEMWMQSYFRDVV